MLLNTLPPSKPHWGLIFFLVCLIEGCRNQKSDTWCGRELDGSMIGTLLLIIYLLLECHFACLGILNQKNMWILLIYYFDPTHFNLPYVLPWFMNGFVNDLLGPEFRVLFHDLFLEPLVNQGMVRTCFWSCMPAFCMICFSDIARYFDTLRHLLWLVIHLALAIQYWLREPEWWQLCYEARAVDSFHAILMSLGFCFNLIPIRASFCCLIGLVTSPSFYMACLRSLSHRTFLGYFSWKNIKKQMNHLVKCKKSIFSIIFLLWNVSLIFETNRLILCSLKI